MLFLSNYERSNFLYCFLFSDLITACIWIERRNMCYQSILVICFQQSSFICIFSLTENSLLYLNYCIPVEFTVFQNTNCIHGKNIFRYQVAVVMLFWAQQRKLYAKYSTEVCEMKSRLVVCCHPQIKIGCVRTIKFSLKLSFLISHFC